MEAVFNSGLDEYDGTGTKSTVFLAYPDLASAFQHIVYFVLRMGPLRICRSNWKFVNASAQGSDVQELKKELVGTATLLQEGR